MKKLFIALISSLMLMSCASGRYISLADPQAEFDAVEILYQQHPELINYYEEGVLKITSLREIETTNGYDYRIKYKFVRYYYDDYSERMAVIKEKFPEIYALYTNGVIEISSLYKYVNDYGEIRHHVSYRRLYDFDYGYYPYIYPYGGYRYYYHPRIIIRPSPQPKPRPEAKPSQPRPNRQPQARPNVGGSQRGNNQARRR